MYASQVSYCNSRIGYLDIEQRKGIPLAALAGAGFPEVDAPFAAFWENETLTPK
jgi:hypothetical protein